MSMRKGIIMAGGTGSRLYPVTYAISKQLLPIYDKPMVYYPITTLMQAGIRDIAIVTTPSDQPLFQAVLGDGAQWGVSFTWIVQNAPEGLAQAYLLAEGYLDGAPSVMILGDNLFIGDGLLHKLRERKHNDASATVFGYHVTDPERYGVLGFDQSGKVCSIKEKPRHPQSRYAVTGIYFLDGDAPKRAAELRPSARGELEITDLLCSYLHDGLLNVHLLERGLAWLDTGTHASLLDAGNLVRTLQERQNLQTGCPEEIALSKGWISAEDVARQAQKHGQSSYGAYLHHLSAQKNAAPRLAQRRA